ncbi:threonine synthase [Lacibacter sediminis]|uniref:Threonine synthase n=1 Tax=Lacibacter sediminis TaxID=2760713 RepID=A0A7G5XBF1_9BACT|nr:threonine synthase [Lacibacter sediminis]QNA42804.1 threonine synthase [Lacibacter sediminis]
MNYYSLNKQSPIASFKEATILGQAPDKGLYFPESIRQVDKELISNIENISNEEIAFRVIKPYIGNEIAEDELYRIVSETVNFPIPLVQVSENISSLELFHGPTLAFKDVGARFMSRCLGQFVKGADKKVTVLVATSGDTGGAVANGFYNVEGVEVVILYPSGKVSSVQEKQLTTLGNNIHALEVNGTFDDCQQLVKQAFTDAALNKELFLTSANSINVARWLPQQFYYFFAYKQWKQKDQPPVICVPSGNFGNICAGILAHMSGLPVKHFVAACNANDIVPNFMQSQQYQPKPAVATISNAMDVGNPSNFVRILELFHQQFPQLKEKFSSVSITDEETKQTMKRVYDELHYTLDPHGAVGYLALERYLADVSDSSLKGIFLETAHPVKFYDVVEPVLNQTIPLPDAVKEIIDLPKKSTLMNVSFEELKDFLLKA